MTYNAPSGNDELPASSMTFAEGDDEMALEITIAMKGRNLSFDGLVTSLTPLRIAALAPYRRVLTGWTPREVKATT